jgi:hypothetical protein
VLAEIARLALEGHSSRAIGQQVGVPRRTVDRWLRRQRLQWAENAADNAAEICTVARARLESIYREAMQAWRGSLADKQVIVETAGDDGGAKPPTSLRKTTQSGQAALLGKAIHAAKEIFNFDARHLDALDQAKATDRCRARRELAEEVRNLPPETFREIKIRLRDEGATPRHTPDELLGILCDLTAEDYREFRQMLLMDYLRRLPMLRGQVQAGNADAQQAVADALRDHDENLPVGTGNEGVPEAVDDES